MGTTYTADDDRFGYDLSLEEQVPDWVYELREAEVDPDYGHDDSGRASYGHDDYECRQIEDEEASLSLAERMFEEHLEWMGDA